MNRAIEFLSARIPDKKAEDTDYGADLIEYLNERFPNFIWDKVFIEKRANRSLNTYKDIFCKTRNAEEAYESAYDILYENLDNSPESLIAKVLRENEFTENVNKSDISNLGKVVGEILSEQFAKYLYEGYFIKDDDYDEVQGLIRTTVRQQIDDELNLG